MLRAEVGLYKLYLTPARRGKMAAAARKTAPRLRAVTRIDFFYDVASPYSWLAFETLMRYRSLWDAEINLRPFLLGGIMSATGNKPPGSLPAKGAYMEKDLSRMARYHGAPLVPLKDPRVMFNTLGAQRLLTAASLDAPAHLEALTRQLWTRLWGGKGEIVTAKGLQEACAGAGLEKSVAESLLARCADAEVKDRLRRVTEEAIERGAFGAPWITLRVSDGDDDDDNNNKPWEAFFGCDRFDVLAEAIGQPWLGPQPSSSRL